MFLPIGPSRNFNSNRSKSISSAAGSDVVANQWIRQFDKRLFRAIDYLHLFVMLFSLYTGLVVTILRNELFEQCPLYANLSLRVNATQFSIETVERDTVWGSAYPCEFASFTYLSIFVLSFISLWLHIVFRRVLRTERLLRLPVGLLTLIFTLLAIVVSSIVTDGVIKFCTYSPNQICSPSSTPVFSEPRWKIISLPVGGWLATISILLNTIARGIQLFSKPKKSPETLKFLINQLMTNRLQEKLEKENSEHGSQISRNKSRFQPFQRYSIDNRTTRDFSSEPYPSYYPPPAPEYRQIKKPSLFKRIFCPCIYRRRRRFQQSFQDPYRPYVIPDEYYHRLNYLKHNGRVPEHLCQHHAKHPSVEQQTQTDFALQRNSIDEPNQTPFLGRRRSSVRFEDEIPTIKSEEETSPSPKTQPIPIIKEEQKPASPVTETNTDLQRTVSFRNNEDDLWTTITINTEQSVPIQSSHYNRLTVENLSLIDTSITNSNSGVTAIHVNSTPNESTEPENIEKEDSSSSPPPPPPPPPPPTTQSSSKTIRSRPTPNRHKPPLPPPSRSHTTTSSDDENNVRHKKQSVEEINHPAPGTYNYNDLSKALRSNVERLKNTFIHAQENQSIYDKPMNIRSPTAKKSTNDYSSDC